MIEQGILDNRLDEKYTKAWRYKLVAKIAFDAPQDNLISGLEASKQNQLPMKFKATQKMTIDSKRA